MDIFDMDGVPPEDQEFIEDAIRTVMRKKPETWKKIQDEATKIDVPVAFFAYIILSKTLSEGLTEEIIEKAKRIDRQDINDLTADIDIDL